uniref:Uncharacterized protein n=1 Tax=Nelumbo nucifera TaxID=4432 RepID=A0A822Z9V8_NELNU|nr:TPA_asm: hypothetical protein HUJ06_015980 [Nelumbo nucifera]
MKFSNSRAFSRAFFYPFDIAFCIVFRRSCPPTSRRNNKTKDQDLTPKKPKPSISPKKQNSKQDLRPATTTAAATESLVITSTNRLGPEPRELPKEVSRAWKPIASSSSTAASATMVIEGEGEKFSDSVFLLSPPPSSLPIPKFSLRPKHSCNVEAGGIDAGATDNLRRLLRLR